MSIYLRLKSHDEVFHSLRRPPVLVNHLDLETAEGRTRLQNLLFTRYEGDSLNVLPSCDCGEVTGNYNLGIVCSNCGTECLSITDLNLESTLWIKAPEGIPKLVNPAAWTMLANALTTSGTNVLEWVCNPQYKPNNPNSPILKKVESLNLPRGYNNFINHFDAVMQILFQNKIPKGTDQDREDLWMFIQENKDRMFSQYLPIPSKVGFVLESNSIISYADTTMTLAIDALKTIASIENSSTPLTQRGRESRTLKAITLLAQYYVSFAAKTLAGKPGVFRKHVFGGRPHFTGRAVITSITVAHDYEELHLPWSLSVKLFKVHLTNKLLKRGMSPVELTTFLDSYTLRYHPLLDELFKELIAEAPGKGIPCILHRNPTLARASAQRFFITVVKTDVEDNTISFSALCLVGPNAD